MKVTEMGMHSKLLTSLIVYMAALAFYTVTLSGCTTQAWYNIAKQGAESNCRRQPQSESERCLENLNKKTYEEYEQERTGQK